MHFTLIPRNFFFVVPLHVGAEIVAACAVLNKVSAVYGLGALITGHGLTVMEWIMNLISFAFLPVTVWGYFSIHRRRSLRTLGFAYLYTIDTFVSLGFTIFFIVYWFAVASKAQHNIPDKGTSSDLQRRVSYDKSMTNGQELAMTIVATTVFLLVRFYFMLVLIGYARVLVRKTNLRPNRGHPPGSLAAKIQYLLLAPFEKFWTGQGSRRGRSRSFGPAETQRLEPSET